MLTEESIPAQIESHLHGNNERITHNAVACILKINVIISETLLFGKTASKQEENNQWFRALLSIFVFVINEMILK